MTYLYLLKLLQVTQYVRSFKSPASFLQLLGKFVHQDKGKEAYEQMPGDRQICLVEDRSCLQE